VSRSLAGRVVLITRPADQGASLAARLLALGAEPLEAPTIVVEPQPGGGPLDRSVREAAEGRFEWVAFTSASGVGAWRDRAEALEAGLPRARVAAVGEATAEALREAGIEPALVPPSFTTAALGESFPQGRGPVLLPRADRAAADLEAAIRAKGWTPVRVDAYRVRPAEALPEEAATALTNGRVDAVTFTSPSTVEGLVRLAGVVGGPAVVCIGPVTAEAARRAGFEVAAVADPHTTEGLVGALVRALRRPPPRSV
jgi:uroporphyrinogen-III synthase